ncbi:retropepsin-like aspartic protease family protein [Profundibacter amoris]|uniref:TIGR02281 family clan AA aspartic protease n=1 Tax=Profundibacter amoris TaxID=2171755 RepID=A0A347UGZ0_9RHOB|nr:TIGR02281 family clan AA aspartic protease [Profundibacter amoris]AXX98118.1 TIGR02281 family clan AA aspartic protease [Profundibacter amoris]
MDGDNLARLIYLVLLGSVIAGYFFAQNRNNLGKTAQQAAVWGLIFVGAVAVIGLWGDIRNSVMPSQSYIEGQATVIVPRANDGHYYVTLEVDGTPVRFVIDTGASDVVLTQDDARKIGIDVDNLFFGGIANTANGEVRTARVKLHNVRLGEITDLVVSASVNAGEMDTSLLGMSYLQRYNKIELGGGKMVLRR